MSGSSAGNAGAATGAAAPETPAQRLTDREAHEVLARYITRNSGEPRKLGAVAAAGGIPPARDGTQLPLNIIANDVANAVANARVRSGRHRLVSEETFERIIQGRIREALKPKDEEIERLREQLKPMEEELERLREQVKSPKGANSGSSLLVLTVSPGRLGLTLSMAQSEVGAEISKINEGCSLGSRGVAVGDRILTVDGKIVRSLDDLREGMDRFRKFCILKAAPSPATAAAGSSSAGTTPAESATNAASAEGATASNPASATAATASAGGIAAKDGTNPTFEEMFNRSPGPFGLLRRLDAAGTDRQGEKTRGDLLTELLQFDKRNKVNTKVNMGGDHRYQVLCIPLKRKARGEKIFLERRFRGSYINQSFGRLNKQSKFMDKFLDAWASYCGGSRDDAADMVLFYMAYTLPHSYARHSEMASERAVMRTTGPQPPQLQLPPDFVSYDGTRDVRWNARYAELVKFREEHGHCKMNGRETDLGRWVSVQRQTKKKEKLSEKRIELLDGLDFVWDATPEGWARPVPGGDPRVNRTVAAKLVYPSLSMREALYLGGFEDEELNVIKDPKYAWRTGYAVNKDRVVLRLKAYDTTRRTGARLQTEKLVDILRGEDEDRLDQVFGDKSHLLPGFLVSSEERMSSDVEENPSSAPSRKRSRDEDSGSDSDVEQQEESAEMDGSRVAYYEHNLV